MEIIEEFGKPKKLIMTENEYQKKRWVEDELNEFLAGLKKAFSLALDDRNYTAVVEISGKVLQTYEMLLAI